MENETSKSKTVFTFDAIPAVQDDIRLFVGVAKAKELINVTTIDRYDPRLSPTDKKQGYQRPPERGRITRIGRFLLERQGSGLFPTAILLASRKTLEYDKKQGQVIIHSDEPLQIVDGQHRLAGLQYVIEEKGAVELEKYEIPFVIMETPDKLVEMTQFRIVNGTAKSVRTDLVNMILTATYDGTPRSEIPASEQWKIVVSNVVDRLAKDPGSPWLGMIILPGESKAKGDGKIIRATSFITSLRPVYVWLKETSGVLGNCRNNDEEIEYMYNLVASYWSALKRVVPDAFAVPDENVIQKTPGLFSLHKLMRHLLGNMYQGRRSFDEETFTEYLSESKEVTDPDFWLSTSGRASAFGSMHGFDELYDIIKEPYVM